MRKGAVKNFILINKVRSLCSPGCSDHEMVELKILRAVRKAHSKLTALHFRRAGFCLFRELLIGVQGDKVLQEEDFQDRWFVPKDHSLQAQEQKNHKKTL